ncbi:hypothetical protein EDD16DRAFT_595532 [Pisolithus croceorrhizus]|nr:hypothetical protein EDD16DRAFT_595532 [Pisolithus croceorrhizus]
MTSPCWLTCTPRSLKKQRRDTASTIQNKHSFQIIFLRKPMCDITRMRGTMKSLLLRVKLMIGVPPFPWILTNTVPTLLWDARSPQVLLYHPYLVMCSLGSPLCLLLPQHITSTSLRLRKLV